MPDWIVHICVAYLVCRILYFKFPIFNSANTVLAMVGSILPDLVKLQIILSYFGIHLTDYLPAFHTPVITFIIAGIISLFFENQKVAFLFLVIGATTHFVLDLLLVDLEGGIYLFFPFSFQTIHINLIPPDDYLITFVVLTLTILIYLWGRWMKKNKE